MRLENLHYFSNLCDNFRFNVIWHRWSMATLILFRGLAESDVTVMPSVICMDWLHCWYKHTASDSQMSETWNSTSPSGIQIKISARQSLFKTRDVISSLKKVEQKADIWRNVRLTHSCACPIPDNADRIKERAKSEQKRLCSKTNTVLSEWRGPKSLDKNLTFLWHYKYINILYGNVCILYRNVHILHTLYRSLCPPVV